jgi:hypothetical protein
MVVDNQVHPIILRSLPAQVPLPMASASYSKGKKDAVGLDGLNVLMAVHSPKQMTEGGWKASSTLTNRRIPSRWTLSRQSSPVRRAVISPTWHL